MPHITKLDLSEENKKNIPPFMLHDNLSNLVNSNSKTMKATPPTSTNNCLNGLVNQLSNYLMPITVNTDSYSNKRTMIPSCCTPKGC